MARLDVADLPDTPSTAAGQFHSRWLPRALSLIEGLAPGEDLVIVFAPADYRHRAWRLAAVQSLAREHAPIRVNGLDGGKAGTTANALRYLNEAKGVTGQVLLLDDAGAGAVIEEKP